MDPVKYLYFTIFLITVSNCQKPMSPETQTSNHTPAWAKHAIWYQIMVERFRNGGLTNNPTRESLKGAWPDWLPESWTITPWTQDWYKKDPWFYLCDDPDFYHGIQARRYGGDLQGVLDKVDYLADLGITAVYFNPLNDAPSMHKYDPAFYHHIDRYFGPDPYGDGLKMEAEIKDDPSKWIWTEADKLFLQVIKAFHAHGIKVIVDYSWNHTGKNFWALEDIRQNGKDSKYYDWYSIYQLEDKTTPAHEMTYKYWAGAPTLPELKENIEGEIPSDGRLGRLEGNIYSPSLKEHIFAVVERWLDPDGDGDPQDGIDGFRLDVAAEVPIGFWKEFRTRVRHINPQAYLVGEIWWEKWPDDLLDPKPFLGEAFDAVMNYRWYREARRYFGRNVETTTGSVFIGRLQQLMDSLTNEYNQAMMNVAASHDSPRLATSLYNQNKYKYQANPRDTSYRIGKPNDEARARQRMLLLHQFTYIGAPHIWYGDEAGMWGADDPDCRKPMVWDDLEYETETHEVDGKQHGRYHVVKTDTSVYKYYKKLIAFRKAHPVLIDGSLELVYVHDEQGLLVYKRVLDAKEIWVFFNNSFQTKTINIPDVEGEYKDWSTSRIYEASGLLSITLPALEGTALIKLN